MTEPSMASPGMPSEAKKLARTYSVGELLIMRNTLPFVIFNVKKLNPKMNSDIIRVPEDVRIDLRRNSRSSRNLISMTRKSASYSSQTPDVFGDSERSHCEMKNGPWSPEDQEEVILFRGNLSLQSHEKKKMWMMRKRGSSEQSSQPFPAPSGFEAQKADNFSKFYAAVISPTHLRVTAGGRIVPNTRVPPHPTFTWNTEKHFFESRDRAFGPDLERQKSRLPSTNTSVADSHSPLGIVKPTFEDYFGPPLHLHSSTRPAAPTERKDVHSSDTATHSAIEEISVEENVASSTSDTIATQGQIKISPPSQFDVFRPFFINGQPFYPAPPNIQVPTNLPTIPFNMLGTLNASYQSTLPAYGMIQSAPLQTPAGNFGHTQSLTLDNQQMGQSVPLMHASSFPHSFILPQLHTPVGQPFGMMPIMPISSLQNEPLGMDPQVVMVANQIQALQQQLKHLENQLQNNKHQIDEQHVIQQQAHIQNQIRALQSGLNSQVFQSSLLPPEQYGLPTWNIGVRAMGGPLASVTNSAFAAGKVGSIEASPFCLSSFQTSVQDEKVLENTEANNETRTALTGDSQGGKSSMSSMQTSRKRLSAAAAMAPEFQPRSQSTIANQSDAVKTQLPVATASVDPAIQKYIDPQKTTEVQVQSDATNRSMPGQWVSSNLMHDPVSIADGCKTNGQTKGNPLTNLSANLQASVPLIVSATAGQETSQAANGVNPYLMGYPPPGISTGSVKSADMIYSRELTREELYARQIYWGKAPQTHSKKLPKFDGKDFYAPSPEKAPVSPKEHHSLGKDRVFRRSNTSSTITEPKSPKSVRNKGTSPSRCESKDSKDLLGSTSSVEQMQYEALAEEIKSSPENDGASLDAWGMAKTDEEEIFDRPAYLTSSFNSRVANCDGTDSFKFKLSFSSKRANGRQAQPSFLKDMLRNTPHTAMAAPTGALSSTVAHGYLPQYAGFASASLSPSKNNVSVTSADIKTSSASRLGSHLFDRVENQPLPRDPLSQFTGAVEHLKKFKGVEKEIVDHDFNPNTKGVGPVYGGSDW